MPKRSFTQQTANGIRRRPDGSIDTAHYVGIGRELRADAIHRACRSVARGLALHRRLARPLRSVAAVGRLAAGAIISGGKGTAKAKIEAMRAARIHAAGSRAAPGARIAAALKG